MPTGMDWTNDVISRLRQLWDEGISTTEIGRRLGVSKNAVIGKAHRLNLSARASPIRSGGPRIPRARVLRLAGMMPTTALAPARPAATVGSPRPKSVAPPTAPGPGTPPRPVLPRGPAVFDTKACCWPIGEPGRPGFHFCNAPAIAGKPYCEQHAAVAYRPKPERAADHLAIRDS